MCHAACRTFVQAGISRLLIGSLLLGQINGFGGAAAIGIAITGGSFEVNRSEVKGNASLFEGSEVRTRNASSKVRLKSGARLELGTDSQARVYAKRAVLERGAGQVEGGTTFGLEALTLRVQPVDSKATARVKLDGASAVLVSAVNGPVRITTASGVVLAKLLPGRSLRFSPGAGEADSVEVSGCVLRKGGSFILAETDQSTNQIFQLQGLDLTTSLGNRVSIKGTTVAGTTPMPGASQVVHVDAVTPVGPGGCLATAASVGADPLPGTSTSPVKPVSHGANKAVIAGVAIGAGAAAGIGIALAGKSKSQ